MSDGFAEALRTVARLSEADTVVAWDVSNLAWRSLHAHPELKVGERLSGHVYGTMSALVTTLTRDLGPGRKVLQIFCYEGRDSKVERRSILPTYKANRDPGRFSPLKDVCEILANVPGLHVAADGTEADDALVWVAETFKDKDVVLVSNDKDLWPLMALPNVRVLKSRAGGGRYVVGRADVDKEYGEGIPVTKIQLAKALHGDSDNIKGIFGLQKRQTAPYLLDPGVVDVDTLYAALAAGPPRKPMTKNTYDKVMAERARVETNHKVVLPIRKISKAACRLVGFDDATKDRLLASLASWQCASILKSVPLLFGNATLVDTPLTTEPEPVIVDG